jgi:tol-pal system protein YbgF
MPVQSVRHLVPVSARARAPRGVALLLGVALSGLAAGCAHAQSVTPTSDEEERELAQLRRENAALRARVQNLEERMHMLERVDARGPADGYASYGSVNADVEGHDLDPWADPELDGPRQLPVVKLTPSGRSIERGGSPEPAPHQRRGSVTLSAIPHGAASAGEVDARGWADDDPYDDHAPAGDQGEPASYRLVGSKLVQATKRKQSVSTSRDRDSGVLKDYKAAMALYEDGRYAEAEKAFAAIVRTHPNHEYADNALYWQGEAAYDQAHYADALAAFTTVVERYGGGNKAPDALLKIGLCYGRLGDAANARDVLTQLIAAYPRTNASKIAKRKLADLD